MSIEQETFSHYLIQPEKLLFYGFEPDGQTLVYENNSRRGNPGTSQRQLSQYLGGLEYKTLYALLDKLDLTYSTYLWCPAARVSMTTSGGVFYISNPQIQMTATGFQLLPLFLYMRIWKRMIRNSRKTKK